MRSRSSSPSSSSTSSRSSRSEWSESDSDSASGRESQTHRLLSSFGMLIGENISDKVKKKILQNKFIDMSVLLPEQSSVPDSDNSYTMSVTGSRKPSFKFVKPATVAITDIHQWLEAWEVFMAIYTSQKSNRKHIQALLTYARDLRNMSRQNYDWSAYDRQFRMDCQVSLCSWSLVRHDLHLMFRNPQNSSQNPFPATKYPSTLPQTNTLTTPDGFILKKGHCIKFHSRGQRCE